MDGVAQEAEIQKHDAARVSGGSVEIRGLESLVTHGAD